MKKITIILIITTLITSTQLFSFDGINIKTLHLDYLKKFTRIEFSSIVNSKSSICLFLASSIQLYTNNGKKLKLVYKDGDRINTFVFNLEVITYIGYQISNYSNFKQLTLFFR